MLEVVKILLGCVGIDINKSDSEGSAPLIAAAYKGHVEVVKILLGCTGIDINKSDSEGQTSLFDAAYEGHVEVVKILLGYEGIDINKSDITGETSLFAAVIKGHAEVVKILLGCEGIDINKSDFTGYTPLIIAVANGNFEVTEMLLESNLIADINVKDKVFGRSALMTAVQKEHPKIVNLLLKYKGIDVNQPCKRGYSPLMAGCIDDTVQMLLNQGVYFIDRNGQTASCVNSHRMRPDIVKALVANKTININAETHSHDTPLHFAAGSGNIEVVRILLDLYKKDKHIDFKKKNLAGETALSLAKGRNYVEVVDVITKHMKKMEKRKKSEIKYEAELQEAIAALNILD